MLLAVQVPVVDIRPLLARESYRHLEPAFPQPERVYARHADRHHQTNFIAGVGPVRPRLRGHDSPWLSESYYVDIGSLVRVRGRRGPYGPPPRLVYRSYYTDGVVGRIEFGFRYHRDGSRDEGEIERTVLDAPTHIRAGREFRLLDIGPEFAHHLLAATTRRKRDGDPESWWIRPGPVAVVREFGLADQHDPNPEWGVRAEDIDGELSYAWQRYRSTRLLRWTLTQGATPANEFRRLRVHISRLHSDFTAFGVVLGLCSAGRLDPEHPPVERYLIRTADLLSRTKRHGFAQSEFLAEIVDASRGGYGDVTSALDQFASSLRNDVLVKRFRKLYDAINPQTSGTYYIENLAVTLQDNKYETHISGGTIGAVSSGSGNAYVQVNTAGGTDVQQLLDQLAEAMRELGRQLPPDEAVTAEDTVDGVRREIERPESERDTERLSQRIKRLLAITTAAGTSGSAVAAAIEALRAALGV